MKGVLFLLAAVLGLSVADARPLSLLVRDLRTVKDGRCVVFNIGTAAHAPSSVAQVLKAWPDADVTLWADAPLEDGYAAMIRRRFPNVGIVWGDLEDPAQTNAALEAAVPCPHGQARRCAGDGNAARGHEGLCLRVLP